MDKELQDKIENLEKKVDAIFISVEKTRRYFLIITWITVIAIVLPLVGLVFAIPTFLNTYTNSFSSVGL